MEKRGWFLCVLGGEYLVRYVVKGESYLCCPLLLGDRLTSNGLEQHLGRAMELLACGPISQYEKLISVASAIDHDGEGNEYYVSDDVPNQSDQERANLEEGIRVLTMQMNQFSKAFQKMTRKLEEFSQWQGKVDSRLEYLEGLPSEVDD